MKKTFSPEAGFTGGFNPMTVKIPQLARRHRLLRDEINRLALAAWVKEGARPGLEQQYVEEVTVQLRATRHLLERECLAMAATDETQ